MNLPSQSIMVQLTKQPKQAKSSFLERWTHIVKEWIDVLLNKSKERLPKSLILSQFIGKECVLLQLERNTPGAVSTWRFNCKGLHEQSLLLTLDNIADLQRHLLRANRQRNPADTTREVVNLPGRTTSHRIAVSLINPVKRPEFIGVWDVNFIDQWATTHAEDYKAERIILYTARRVMSFYDVMPEAFEAEIRSKEWWEERILYMCQGEFQENHQINLVFCSEARDVAK